MSELWSNPFGERSPRAADSAGLEAPPSVGEPGARATVCDPPVGASMPDDSLWTAPGLQLRAAGLGSA